jgi:hypothetical protein
MIAGTRTDASLFHSTPIEASEMLPGNPDSQHRGRPKQHSKTALSPEKPRQTHVVYRSLIQTAKLRRCAPEISVLQAFEP